MILANLYPTHEVAPHKSKHRYYKPMAAKNARKAKELEQDFGCVVEGKTWKKEVDSEVQFTKAATGKKGEGKQGSSDARRKPIGSVV